MATLGPLNTVKEIKPTGYKPLLLAVFVFPNGDVLRCSTDALSSAYPGGFPYQGPGDLSAFAYLPLVTNQDLAVSQALSDQGIDRPPTVAITLADPSKSVWLQWEDQTGHGFKGATLSLRLIFTQVGINTFTSDQLIVFNGVCEAPDGDDKLLYVTANSRLNMSRLYLPGVSIQRRCPWNFPQGGTTAVLLDALNNPDSISYQCGYSYGVTGGVGNVNPSTGQAFTVCNNIVPDCVARGMYDMDHTSTVTRRYGGIQWSPNVRWFSRAYGDSNKTEGVNNLNEAKYGDFIPMIYGEGWVDLPSMAIFGEANSTRAESPVCFGQADDIIHVIVNDVEIEPANNMDLSGLAGGFHGDNLLRYNHVSTGARNGNFNGDVPWTPTGQPHQGDPYGSITCIEWCVHQALAASITIPSVRALVRGPKIPVFTSQTAFTMKGGPLDSAGHPFVAASSAAGVPPAGNQNLVWVVLDIIKRSRWKYAQCNMATWIAAAALCDTPISYTDQNGATMWHSRFTASLVIRTKTAASELVRGLRNAGRLLIFQYNGLLECHVRGTIADQQPSPVPGSNYNSTVSSLRATAAGVADGSTGNGYIAYNFDESNIIRLDNGASTLRLSQTKAADTPNSIGFQFQDADNTYASDSLTLIDSYDLALVQQEIDSTFPVYGIQTFDQGERSLAVEFTEINRGNFQGDTRGSRIYEWQSGPYALSVQVGHIICMTSVLWNLTFQQLRVLSVKPSTNYETVTIRARWHADVWYTDGWAQHPPPPYSGPRNQDLLRPPYGWAPFGQQPPVGDSMFAPTDYSFTVAQSFRGISGSPIITDVTITGTLPINTFSAQVAPPFVRQGTSAATGGTIPDGNFWARLCGIDSTGLYSTPGPMIRVLVPPGTGINTITIPNITWDPNTVNWELFGGTNPNVLTSQAIGPGVVGTPSIPTSITITSINAVGKPIPDSEFERLVFRLKQIKHSGVAGVQIASVTPTTITLAAFPSLGLFAGWIGYDVSVLAQYQSANPVPLADFPIASSIGTQLTIATGGPDPTVVGLKVGDVVSLRIKPTIGSDATGNYIEDLNFINSMCPFNAPVVITTIAPSGGGTFTQITTATPHGLVLNSPLLIQGPWISASGNHPYTSVAVPVDTLNFIVAYPQATTITQVGNTVSRQVQGLEENLAGFILRCVSGPGEGYSYTILSNTQTRIYIQGAWTVTPTSASRLIVENSSWTTQTISSPYIVTKPNTTVTFDFRYSVFDAETVFIQVGSLDHNSFESFFTQEPSRELYVFGQTSAGGVLIAEP